MRALNWRSPALLVACLGLAALTLLAPSSPSYDPFAWIVWGRELVGAGETFGVAGGPSWKPLPVLFTAPFSLLGGAAPALWLLVARAGALLAVAGAFRLGERLAARWAGGIAAVAVLLLDDFVSLAWRGASEPLLLACILWACERHLTGRRRFAFALGVAAALIRPEVVPFLLVYAVVEWRDAEVRDRLLLIGGLALVPLLWLGVPAIGGDALAASSTATNNGSAGRQVSALTALGRGLALPLVPLWALACAAVLLRPRDRTRSTLLSAAAAWLALVVAMTAAGYSGVARYMLPAAALACVLGAVGTVELLAWARRASRSTVLPYSRITTTGQGPRRSAALAVAVVGALALTALAAERATTLDDQVREGIRVARAHDDLRAAIDVAGGAAALRRCALGGWVAINHTAQSTLAWELRIPLDRAARTMRPPGIEISGRRSAAIGAPPPIAPAGPHTTVWIARAGVWTVASVAPSGVPLPAACTGVKASPGGVRARAQNHVS